MMVKDDKRKASFVAVVCAALLACGAEATDTHATQGDNGGSSSGGGSSASGGSAEVSGGTGSSGTSGATSGGTGGGSGAATGGSGGGDVGGSGGGSSSSAPCTAKVTVQTPVIADFESYDGMVAAADFQWIFGGATANELGVHAGTYAFGDGSAEPTLSLLAGHGGNYGLSVSVTEASAWGLGFGMFFMDENYNPGCIDASQYQGVSMWVRGSVPTGTFSFGVTMPQATASAEGGSCSGTDDTTCKSPTATNLPVTMTWTQVDVLWSDLTGGLSGPATPLVANGDDITGFSFGANLTFEPESEGSETYVPVPGDIDVDIDDLTFIP